MIFNCFKKKKSKQPQQEPERPTIKYEFPEIVDVDINIKTQGNYRTNSGQARGLVVHFTAGRFDKGKESALNTMRWLGKSGLGCLVMDTNGNIYKSKDQDLDQVAWHAGKSSWKGKSGISRYCIGMEICCAGKLDVDNKSWYGLQIPTNQARVVDKKDNVQAGHYHKYTVAQEEALFNFCKWQMQVNPDFDVDWVVGHDEIAPRRKNDPGGSFSMTMPEFREQLKSLI